MLSIANYNHQRDVLPRNPVADNDTIRYGSDIRSNTISSPYSTVLMNSSGQSSFPSFHHPCLSLTNISACDQLSMLPISPVSFPITLTRRPRPAQMSRPPNLDQPTFGAWCARNLQPSTSHLSKQSQSIQLFIKSIRNTTISIHIDSTSSISDLKLLIYAHDGIPPCDLRLIHRGRELRDDALLLSLDVDGATMTCLLRVFGGNPYGSIPLYWWFGFSRSYEDGRAGEEGRTLHVLSGFKFDGASPSKWYSDSPLSSWKGIKLHSDVRKSGVSSIFLFSCDILQLPDSISSLVSLSQLHFHRNKLTQVPDSICSLQSLEVLYLSENQLSALPSFIGNLKSLSVLDADHNLLTRIPDSIGNMRSLTYVNVNNNQLSYIPGSIGNLPFLAYLSIVNNQLCEIPDSIGNLSLLAQLLLTNNLLIILPDSIGSLRSLTRLAVGNNPMTNTKDGADTIKNRFQRGGLIIIIT